MSHDRDSLVPNDQYYQEYSILVDQKQTPIRLDKFLMDRIENATRSRLQNGIKTGAITVNDVLAKASYKVRPLDRIEVVLPRTEDYVSEVIPEDIPLDIVYEDDSVLVVNKPAGMVVHPGVSNYSGTLANALMYYFKHTELPIKDGNLPDRPGLVHRIDKDTSGLLVIAKDEESMSHLSKQFANHTTERTYWTICWGDVEESGTIDKPIGRDPKNRLIMHAFPPDTENTKRAITHYKKLENLYYVSLVECKLETGRTHQIRVHLASEGHPIFSDSKYGGSEIVKGTVFTKYKQFVKNCFDILPRQALHAKTLAFDHPKTGARLQFDSEIPKDFREALDKWRRYVDQKKDILQ